MCTRAILKLWFVATFAMLMIASSAQAQATRTWVSGVGDDANPCSRTAPCKTFAGAISKTAAGGEIDVIDPGGYGAVTITKAITIDGTGANASILNASTNGIVINAAPDDDVILRNLSIQASQLIAPPACRWTGLSAIRLLAARTLRVENVTINNQNVGVDVVASGSNPDIFLDVLLKNVSISNTCTAGVKAAPAAGHPVRMAIEASTISNANTALRLEAGSETWMKSSSLFLNNLGIDTSAGGVLHSLGGNAVAGNASDGSFTDVIDGTPAPAPAPAPAVTLCTVKRVTGKTKAQASQVLAVAGCKLGRVKYIKARKRTQRKKVLSQTIPSGVQVLAGTRVNVTIGK